MTCSPLCSQHGPARNRESVLQLEGQNAAHQEFGFRVPRERCALIESFAIHFRNLVEFFYNQGPKDSDVVAADFFDDPAAWSVTPSSVLVTARKRADKEVSHLTLQRKNAADPDKNWPVGDYFKQIRPMVYTFVETASPKKRHPSVKEWLNRRIVSGHHSLADRGHCETISIADDPVRVAHRARQDFSSEE